MTDIQQAAKHGYGWKPDRPDFRDNIFRATAPVSGLPKAVDLRPLDSPVFDQGQTNSCTGQSSAALVEFIRLKEKFIPYVPSRLFAYYNGRLYENEEGQDSGAMLRDVVKGIANYGICSETDWPFEPVKITTRPDSNCYTAAKKDIATVYSSIADNDINHMKACLAEGFPFIFGFSVYTYMESEEMARTGILRMPTVDDSQLGGHAVMAVGYDDATSMFIIRNSWGIRWGLKGYFLMPYAYITHSGLTADFWTIRATSA